MPAEFRKFGIRFQYPENWSLDAQGDPDLATDERSVSVASPGGPFWTLSIHPHSSDLAVLTQTVLGVLQGEFTDLDFEPASDRISEHDLDGFDVHFYCLDFLNTATIRGFKTARAACVLLCQAEDRDFAQFEPIFRAITTSLLRNELAEDL